MKSRRLISALKTGAGGGLIAAVAALTTLGQLTDAIAWACAVIGVVTGLAMFYILWLVWLRRYE